MDLHQLTMFTGFNQLLVYNEADKNSLIVNILDFSVQNAQKIL